MGPDFDRECFAGPDHLIDRDGLVRYRVEIGVGFDLVETALHIANLSATATAFFSHVCCCVHGRGLVWGWRERTLVNVEGMGSRPSCCPPRASCPVTPAGCG